MARADLRSAPGGGGGGRPGARAFRRWLELLIFLEAEQGTRGPGAVRAYVQLVAESREVVIAHVQTLTRQLAGMIADGVQRGEFTAVDPTTVGPVVFDATARFHNPVHASEWSDPGIDAAFERVWSLIMAALGERA